MISKHISYREATRSITALRNGINNMPNNLQLTAMRLIAEKVFEPLRKHFNVPIKIESFFRCFKLNKKIGGSLNSQHMVKPNRGAAIDLDDDFNPGQNSKYFFYIAENLEFDQLIWEFGNKHNPGWIHVSYKKSDNRNKISIAYKLNGKTRYKHFYNLNDFVLFKEEL